jgi:hypothetical protein
MSKYKEKNLKARYGITLQEFNELKESQNNRCAICCKPLNPAHVDHDHSSSLIRGLLCNGCNVGLGMFKEKVYYLLSAVDYLIKPRKNG